MDYFYEARIVGVVLDFGFFDRTLTRARIFGL
jgi:hypothetical protein